MGRCMWSGVIEFQCFVQHQPQSSFVGQSFVLKLDCGLLWFWG